MRSNEPLPQQRDGCIMMLVKQEEQESGLDPEPGVAQPAMEDMPQDMVLTEAAQSVHDYFGLTPEVQKAVSSMKGLYRNEEFQQWEVGMRKKQPALTIKDSDSWLFLQYSLCISLSFNVLVSCCMRVSALLFNTL